MINKKFLILGIFASVLLLLVVHGGLPTSDVFFNSSGFYAGNSHFEKLNALVSGNITASYLFGKGDFLNVNSSNYWDGYDTPAGWDTVESNDMLTDGSRPMTGYLNMSGNKVCLNAACDHYLWYNGTHTIIT